MRFFKVEVCEQIILESKVMGWKGTLRSLNAAAKAAHRDSQRREKERQKNATIAEAADAVDRWEEHIEDILGLHTNLAEAIDWYELADRLPPIPPVKDVSQERKLETQLDELEPGVLDFLQGGFARKRSKLERKLQTARSKADQIFASVKADYEKEYSDWLSDKEIATRLISGEAKAVEEVIEELQSFSDQELIGKQIQFHIKEKYLHVVPLVHTDEIVPRIRRKQLASGKLSESKMPVAQFNAMYQDYVASVALKVGGDIFNLLPLGEV